MARINGFIGRRHFLKLAGTGGLAIAATSISGNLLGGISESAIADVIPNQPHPVNPHKALQRLLDGNQRFIQQKRQYPHQSLTHLQSLVKAQYPFAAILGCADSRVPAEIIFDQGIGDLFVVRVAGNIADDLAIGSLEYTTSVLGTQLIVVLGHQSCGAVAAAMKNQPLPGKMDYLVEGIKPALTQLNSTDAVIANVQYQVNKLQQNSTVLSQLIQASKLKIVGACYDIDTGKVSVITT